MKTAKAKPEFFVVRCKTRNSLFVMRSDDYAQRMQLGDFYEKKGAGKFIGGGWVEVPGRRHKARLFAADGGGDYYVFADFSILAKQPQ